VAPRVVVQSDIVYFVGLRRLLTPETGFQGLVQRLRGLKEVWFFEKGEVGGEILARRWDALLKERSRDIEAKNEEVPKLVILELSKEVERRLRFADKMVH
jgi:hypothetical protein